MMYLYMCLLTTHSCIYTVVAPTQRQLLLGWNNASQTSATGCPPTTLSSTQTRLSELLWVGSRHSLSQQDCCPAVLQLDPDSIVARDYVRLLGVTLSSSLSFDRHVSSVSASSFYWLRQLRSSLDTESAATFLHSFVASRVDYCNALLAGTLRVRINKLQRVLNAAARVVSGMHKFDRGLSRLLHTDLHWLDVSERVMYKLGVMAFNCLHGQAFPHLVELCQPVADTRRDNISDPPPDSS